VLRVAAVMLAFVPAHHTAAPSLVVSPQVFSPRTGVLRVTGRLHAPAIAGLRLATLNGHELGWLLQQRRRRGVAYSWHGRVGRRRVPDGLYLLQVVAGTNVLARAAFRLDATAPTLTGFRASNGGRPFAGDGPLLTTISPSADGRLGAARIAFTLSETSRVALRVERTDRRRRLVSIDTVTVRPGRHVLHWAPPAATAFRTYLLELTATDTAGNSRSYGARTPYVDRYLAAPVVRVLGIDASFTRQSYAPGETALLRVATGAPSFTMRFFRAGGESRPSAAADELSGAAVTDAQSIS
jgi:hypothetical protein